MSYRGLTKGRTIELEEPLPFPEGQAVRVSVEPWGSTARLGSPQAILQAVRAVPHLRPFEVDGLETAIGLAKLSVRAGVALNEGE